MLSVGADGVAAGLGRVRVHVVVYVLLHFRFSGEASSAVGHRAAEGSVALVGPGVLVQDRLLAEVLPALRAFVGFLPGVDPQVLVEDGSLAEVPPAVDAAVGFLVGVYS